MKQTFNNLQSWFSIDENELVSRKLLLLLVFIAFAIGVGTRMVWVMTASDNPENLWNEEVMLTTNDAYHYTVGPRLLLDGDINGNSNLFHVGVTERDGMMTLLPWLATLLTPFSLDTVALYLPAIISSLVVIPLILIGRMLGSTLLGFIAALLTVTGRTYMDRTRLGYFDTDIFVLLLPLLLIFLLLRTVRNHDTNSAFLASMFTFSFPYMYANSAFIGEAIVLVAIGYILVFERDEIYTPATLLVLTAALANVGWPINLQLALVVGAYLFAHYGKVDRHHLWIITIVAMVAILPSTYFFDNATDKFGAYFSRGAVDTLSTSPEDKLYFLDVIGTVSEAKLISWNQFTTLVSGSDHSITLIAALFGAILLLLSAPKLVTILPLAVIGLLSFKTGERFAMYFVPVYALGFSYLLFLIKKQIPFKPAGWLIIFSGTVAAAYPSVQYNVNYNAPTVFNFNEVAVLDAFGKATKPKDHLLSWWDYGYPIHYYAGKSTITDGAKHGKDNFIISKILSTDSQTLAANLAIMAVEKHAKGGGMINTIFRNENDEFISPDKFFEQLNSPEFVPTVEKSREIYLYLPFRMLHIYAAIRNFSNRNPSTQETWNDSFHLSTQFTSTPEKIDIGSGFILHSEQGVLETPNGSIKINSYIETHIDGEHRTHINIQKVDENSHLSVVYLKSYNTMVIVDQNILNSTYFKLFFFEDYDKERFELSYLNPWAKIYRVKR